MPFGFGGCIRHPHLIHHRSSPPDRPRDETIQFSDPFITMSSNFLDFQQHIHGKRDFHLFFMSLSLFSARNPQTMRNFRVLTVILCLRPAR
jgi:hypothetical protein